MGACVGWYINGASCFNWLACFLVLMQVSEASFVRAMDASGIGLSREELGLVINRYRVPGGGGAIDYQRFCDQSNKVREMTTTRAHD